jgi:hypothetical protein
VAVLQFRIQLALAVRQRLWVQRPLAAMAEIQHLQVQQPQLVVLVEIITKAAQHLQPNQRKLQELMLEMVELAGSQHTHKVELAVMVTSLLSIGYRR